MINAGIKRAVYMYPYPDELSRTLRDESGMVSEVYADEDAIAQILRGAMPGER